MLFQWLELDERRQQARPEAGVSCCAGGRARQPARLLFSRAAWDRLHTGVKPAWTSFDAAQNAAGRQPAAGCLHGHTAHGPGRTEQLGRRAPRSPAILLCCGCDCSGRRCGCCTGAGLLTGQRNGPVQPTPLSSRAADGQNYKLCSPQLSSQVTNAVGSRAPPLPRRLMQCQLRTAKMGSALGLICRCGHGAPTAAEGSGFRGCLIKAARAAAVQTA